MFRHILIPTDGSDLATQAVDKGIALAGATNADVTVVTVTGPFHILSTGTMQVEGTRASYDSDATAHAQKILKAACDKGSAAGVSVQTRHLWHDNPSRAIIDAALADGCDLIAIASHGRRGVAAAVMGSQTAKILTHSKIPVLVYR
ncbi:universal stress protein [Paracoccus sediminis]|uniref:Universal stress protein n=1 Tax=Paracoccus sediminis TaxID=1214787 RepID=A0A238UR54_9RHOB|nr:universal stress protein [Paracoccus sediminis]TBN52920.1 universal stress protein [Paracoccus sediminis]SNR24431.1 Nucleotide-binding universal stress protein, UspA family [Paracoccus sediminis]